MPKRDYDKDPIVVEATIRVYIYDSVPNLEERLERATENLNTQSCALGVVFDAIGDQFGAGLDDLTFKVK